MANKKFTNRVMKRVIPKVTPISSMGTEAMILPNHSGDNIKGFVSKTPVKDVDFANKKYVDDKFPVTHASTTGQTANDHHNESHNIASHSDTSATGTELNTLTDNSIANTLHRHSELVASDGSPDPALSVNASGKVGIGTSSPNDILQVQAANAGMILESTDNNWTSFKIVNNGASTPIDFRMGASIEANNYVYLGSVSAHSLALRTTNVPRMMINATGMVGIGTTTPATSALLDLTSTTGALLLTRMSTAQRDSLTAVNGMILYNTTLNKVQVYEGGAWASVI